MKATIPSTLLSSLLGFFALPSALALEVVNSTPANNQANLNAAAGQTFTAGTLGSENQLFSITVRGPQTTPSATVLTMKVWKDLDQDFATWDPDALVATSTNSLALATSNADFVFLFSGELLEENTVYAVSFSDGITEHVGYRSGLTNDVVALTDGALFSAGVQPFGGGFDTSFVVTANSGTKDIIWTGVTDGIWDTATQNWALSGGAAALFGSGDGVTFDDTAATGVITISGAADPGSIAVNNATLNYELGGDPLTGLAELIKTGAAGLTLTGDHAYLGGTTLTEGTITAGNGTNAGEIGLGPVSLAAGTTLRFFRDDFLDYKAQPKMRNVSGEGDIVLDGGVILFNYPSGGLAFAGAGTWADFSGGISIIGDSELQTIRNGSTAMGTGTITLGDATTSGSLSQIEGNWTWTNDIIATGPENYITNRSAGFGRSLKLQGILSGDGSLTLEDATGAMDDPSRGFIITTDLALTQPLTIATGTPVRIGGVPGEVSVDGTGLDADSFGSLGATDVINDGFLTFARTDAYTVSNAISGFGDLRFGIPSAANRGDTSTQVVTLATTPTHEGTTTVLSGTLVLPSGVSLPNEFVTVELEGVLAGDGSVDQDLDVFGTLSPGEGVGAFTVDGILGFVDQASYLWEVATWGGTVPGTTHDFVTAAGLDFLLTLETPFTIVIASDEVSGFTESNQTYTIATSTTAITGFDAGSIVIDDTAFAAATGSAGTWAVQLSGDGLSLELVYTLGVASPYNVWASSFAGLTDRDPLANPDGDCFVNLLEFALDGDPTVAGALTTETVSASELSVTFSRRDDFETTGSLILQWSENLEDWTDITIGAETSGPVTVTENGTDSDSVEVTLLRSLSTTDRLFIRLVADEL